MTGEGGQGGAGQPVRIKKRGSVLAPSALAEHDAWKRATFESFLPRGHTELSLHDLKAALQKLHLPEQRVAEIFAQVDTSGDGLISFDEFSQYADRHELELRNAFAAVDVDETGSISTENIQALLDRMQMSCSRERRDEIVRALDMDGTGQISFEEYRTFFALLDPEDLLRSLDESSSFGDLPTTMMADLFKKPRVQKTSSALVADAGTTQGTAEAVALQLIPGGLAGCCAQSFVQPVETLKVRLQAESAGTAPPRYGSMTNALRMVLAEEGVLALWKGMAPSALRELSYSTLRFGLYRPIKKALGAGTPRDTPLWKMMAAGGAAGGVASLIASPTDLLKTRMQADAGAVPKPLSAHVGEIYAQTGVLGFWRGASATVVRAVTLGAVKMASCERHRVVETIAAARNVALLEGFMC